MEHVKHLVRLQKFNFGKQKSTTSVVPFLSGGLCELLSHIRYFSQGNFQFPRAKVSDTSQSKYAIYAPGCYSYRSYLQEEEKKDKKQCRQKRSDWVKDWLTKRNILGFERTLLQEFRSENEDEYRKFLRMKAENFDELLDLIDIPKT